MGHEFVCCCSFVLLLFVMIAHGDGVNVLRLHNMDSVDQQKQESKEAKSSGRMGMATMAAAAADETDPWSKVFTLLKDIGVGKKRPIFYPYVDDPSSLEFLPEEKTRNIPLSSKALPQLLRFFSVSPDSVQALAIKKALKRCESTPEQGEINHCATSLESLADFAHHVHGSEEFRILRTSRSSKSTPIVQNYTVIENKEIATGKMIACHYQGYPYALYYCHVEINSMNKVFMLSLIGDNGQRVTGPFLCHMNTSQWNESLSAFHVLGVKPGESEVCHSLPAHDLVVVPK